MNKKIYYVMILITMTITLLIIKPIFVYANNPVVVEVDGQRIHFQDQEPIIINNRVLVPIRGVFEQMGFRVCWDTYARRAYMTSIENHIRISAGASSFWVSGENIIPDVPPQIINGRLMLPLRAVAEAVGASVCWDPVGRVANIVLPVSTNRYSSPETLLLHVVGMFDTIFYRVDNENLVAVEDGVPDNARYFMMEHLFAVWAALNNIYGVELIDYTIIETRIRSWSPCGYPFLWAIDRLIELTLSPEFLYYFEGENGLLLAEGLANTLASSWRLMGGGAYKQVNLIVSGEVIYSRDTFPRWQC